MFGAQARYAQFGTLTPPSQEFQKSSMSQASTYERHSVAALGSDQR